jgi:signal transduction histidine kinase
MEVYVVDSVFPEVRQDREPALAEPVSWSDESRVLLEVDAVGTILRLTPAARRLLADDADLTGHPFHDLLSDTDRSYLSGGSSPLDPRGFASLLLFPRGSSTPACVVSAARASGDSGDAADGTVLLWGRPPGPRDLREARVLAAARYEIVGQIASGVAHELNNVLSTVTTFSDLLLAQTERGSATWNDLVEIKEAALEAAEVARGLDLFGGGRSKGEGRIQIDDVVARLRKLMRRFLPGEIELEIQVAEDCPPVHADPVHFEASLMAMLANARDAMAEGGTLSLSAAPFRPPDPTDGPVPWLRIEVTDTGAGPPAQDMDPAAAFFSTKPMDRGTGLGTAYVYRLAASMGGRFALAGRPGGGAVACLELPGCADEPGLDRGVAT